MISLFKLVFIISLSFNSSLSRDGTKFISLNNEPCMIRPTLIGLNPFELKYYPFMISLGKCSWSCNALSLMSYVLKKDKTHK